MTSTKWNVFVYEVWEGKDGFHINETYKKGTVLLDLKPIGSGFKGGVKRTFYSLNERQIRDVLALPNVRLSISWNGTSVYVEQAINGFPLGELHCVSHANIEVVPNE
jgi:hypothetical protein